jgi:hypothetical protein
MSNLAQLRDRVEQAILDMTNAIFPTGLIDEGLRVVLDQYSLALPLAMETVLTLPGDGREIALESVTGLLGVHEVWWPYDSAAVSEAAETWPPNRVRGFRLLWDDARPILFLNLQDGPQPQQGDELRLWYTRRHAIQDLDGADASTLPLPHESMLVLGAAGQAAFSRAVDLVEIAGTDLYQVGLLGTWGQRRLRTFREWLKEVQQQEARGGPAWGAGWQMDRWERRKPLFGRLQ